MSLILQLYKTLRAAAWTLHVEDWISADALRTFHYKACEVQHNSFSSVDKHVPFSSNVCVSDINHWNHECCCFPHCSLTFTVNLFKMAIHLNVMKNRWSDERLAHCMSSPFSNVIQFWITHSAHVLSDLFKIRALKWTWQWDDVIGKTLGGDSNMVSIWDIRRGVSVTAPHQTTLT